MLALALPLGCLGSGDDAGARAGGDRLGYALVTDPPPTPARLERVARTIQQRLTDEGLGDVRVTARTSTSVLEASRQPPSQRARIEALVEGPGQLWVAVATPDGEVDRRLRAALPGIRLHRRQRLRSATTAGAFGVKRSAAGFISRGPVGRLARLRVPCAGRPGQRSRPAGGVRSHPGRPRADQGGRSRSAGVLRHTKVTLATNGEHGRIEVELVSAPTPPAGQQLTSRPEHLGQRLALVVGRDRVLSAPTLQAPMGDRGRITMAGATAADRGAMPRSPCKRESWSTP